MEKFDDVMDQFHYEMYIAEKEMLDKLSNAKSIINNAVLTEEAVEVIQESLKDSLMNYIHKVVGGTQNAWNNFKTTIIDKGINKYYNENANYFKSNFVMKPPQGFSLPNLKEYETFISNTIIQPYTPSMDSDLNDVNEFLAKQIPEYSADIKKGTKLKDIADKKLFTPAKGTENIGTNYMSEVTRFAAVDYKKVSEKLSTNLKNLNSSTKSMESLLKMVTPANSSTTSAGESSVYNLDDTMSHYFTEEEALQEKYFKTVSDVVWVNADKYKKGEINLCFVTGLSGSGKTVISKMISDEKEMEHCSLDALILNKERFTMDEIKKSGGELLYSFFKGEGKKYFFTTEEYEKDPNNKAYYSGNDYMRDITNDFVDYAIKYANSHKNKRFIVEGVWLYLYIEPQKLKDYAVYIKGTSALKSAKQGYKRDIEWDKADGENPNLIQRAKMMKQYITQSFRDERLVEKYRRYFDNISDDTIKMDESTILEAEENNSNNNSQQQSKPTTPTTNDNEKKGFTSADQSGNSGADDKQKNLDKVAKVYFKACTTVIPEQLSVTNKMVSSCFKMMHEYVALQKKNNSEESNKHQQEQKNNKENNNGQSQVKI